MKNLIPKWRGRGAALLLVITSLAAHAAADVKTLGGGPNQTSPAKSGATDGDTFAYAKFRNPYGIAVDTNGNLLIADQGNNKVRKVTKPGQGDSLTSTFASRLPAPVGVVVDGSNYVYVLTQRDGKLRKFSGAGALIETTAGYRTPTALALGPDGTLYVAEMKGNIYKGGTLIATGFLRPRGLAALADGSLAVAESAGHAIWKLSSTNGINYTKTIIAGGSGETRNLKGLMDGPGAEARFNSPYGLAVAPNGALVVADRLNHRLRVVDTNHTVSSLYGVLKSAWVRPFAGWVDGAGGESGIAAARDPIGLTVASNGTVYVGEIYWDLIRQASGTGLSLTNNSGSNTNGNGGGNTNILVAPLFGPTSGYYPFGVNISVTSSVPVYYTTDGTEPTTNSASVTFTDNVGTIRFLENLRDLTSLRLKAISASGESVTVGGQPASANEIGIPRDIIAGSGSTILVPVVANLRPGARVQSFQYIVEIEPLNGAPAIQPYLRGQSIGTNDFVPLATSAAAGKVARYTTLGPDYNPGNNAIYMVVTASGTNANVDFQNFATTTLLVVPVDPGAPEGSTYRIRVRAPSATSDGYSTDLPVSAGAARTITVTSTPYLVGDVAPGAGYNAGEFGNRDLKNNDANGVLYASVGLRVPFPFTDAYNAMDAWPSEPDVIGGDGQILYADWQVVLYRSLRLDLENWTRSWFFGGLQSDPVPLDPPTLAPAPSKAKSQSVAKTAEAGWSAGATLLAGNIANNSWGHCEVPVSIKVAPGQSVGGLAFRVVVEPVGNAPAVSGLSFTPALGQPGFVPAAGGAANDIVCAWSMVPVSPFSPVLTGQQVIGTVHFQIPPHIGGGQGYKIRFVRPSGAADLDTAVRFEGIPGSAWPFAAAAPNQLTSDEWRVHHFGDINAAAAQDDADPDEDSVPNWQEYINGTNP